MPTVAFRSSTAMCQPLHRKHTSMALTAAAGAAQYCMVPTSTSNVMGTEFVRRACALSGFAPLGFRPVTAHVVNRKSLYANCSAPLGLMIWRAQAYRRLMLGRPITPSLPMAHINLPETGQRDVMCVTCYHPCHICSGTGPTPATSAPGLGPPLPHLHRDWAALCLSAMGHLQLAGACCSLQAHASGSGHGAPPHSADLPRAGLGCWCPIHAHQLCRQQPPPAPLRIALLYRGLSRSIAVRRAPAPPRRAARPYAGAMTTDRVRARSRACVHSGSAMV